MSKNNDFQKRTIMFDINLADDLATIEGYAVVFNTESEVLSRFYKGKIILFKEKINPQALDKCDLTDVIFVRNHDRNLILSRVEAGTLKLTIDDKGLKFSAKLNNSTIANDSIIDIRSGNINKCSFTFWPGEQIYTNLDKDVANVEVLDIRKLDDISIVTRPAYKQTIAELRSEQEYSNLTTAEMRIKILKHGKFKN